MTSEAKALFQQALNLDAVERAELIDALFHSFDKRLDRAYDVLWAEEAESRIDAFERGEIRADSAESVFERIGRRQ